MRVTINRAELLNAAKRAAAIAASSSPVKELTCALLETDAASGKLTVTSTNMETSLEQKIRCTSHEEDALAVNAKLLAAMLEKLPGETAELRRKGRSPTLQRRRKRNRPPGRRRSRTAAYKWLSEQRPCRKIRHTSAVLRWISASRSLTSAAGWKKKGAPHEVHAEATILCKLSP